MNKDVQHMVSQNIVSMEIIIQGKSDIRERTTIGMTLKPSVCNAFRCEFRQADMGVILNVLPVIKSEWAFQGVGIEQEYKDSQRGDFQKIDDVFKREVRRF